MGYAGEWSGDLYLPACAPAVDVVVSARRVSWNANCGSVPVCQENPLTSNRWAVLKSPPSCHPSHGPQVETSFQSLKIFRLFSSPARGICMQVPFIQTPSCSAHNFRSLPRAWKSSIHFPFELVEPSPSGTWSREPGRASHQREALQQPIHSTSFSQFSHL